MCLPALLVFTSLWSLHLFTVHSYAVRRSYRNRVKEISGNFKDPTRVGFTDLKKIVILLKIRKWQHKLVRDYKRRKLVCYILNNNATKPGLYGLKISESIEIEHFFQSKTFFISVAISTRVASASLRLISKLHRIKV